MYGNTLYPRIKSFLVLYEGRCSYFHETRARRGARRALTSLSRREKIDDRPRETSTGHLLNVCVSRDRLTRNSAILSILLDANCVGFRTSFRGDGGAVIEERSSRETDVINFLGIDRPGVSYFVFVRELRRSRAAPGNPAGY